MGFDGFLHGVQLSQPRLALPPAACSLQPVFLVPHFLNSLLSHFGSWGRLLISGRRKGGENALKPQDLTRDAVAL